MHVLAKYLGDNNIQHGHFASELGISKKHLSEIINRKTGISMPLAGTIKEKTGISVDELLEECSKTNKATA